MAHITHNDHPFHELLFLELLFVSQEVIERTLSCSVCGLVSDVYESKVRHESQCLNRYLAVIGNSTEGMHTTRHSFRRLISKVI